MQTLQINATLQSGKYTIKKVLGQGGFGITYLAEHELLGTKVAIKEFFLARYCERDEYSSHVEVCSLSNVEEVKRYEEKFMKEARIIARLNHPNIVKIHDVFRENNTAYYVMDYLEGESLSAIVKKRGSLSEQEAVGYVRQVGKALAYIHEQHLNHLDVKPANIMIDSYGNAILIDFGGAKQYDIQSGEASTTTQVFSNGYAPIEQSNNGGVKKFSPATDIYALGATLYKLVTGVTPPPSNDVLNDGLPQFSASGPIVAAIYSAMQPRQNDRPQSVAEWIKLLDGKSAGYTQFNFSSSSSRNTNYQEDESTRVIKPAWQEEEERRQKEQAEKNWRELEEQTRIRQEELGRKHQEEMKRKQEEQVAKQRKALEQERLAQKRKEQEQEHAKIKGRVQTILFFIVGLVIVIFWFVKLIPSPTNNQPIIQNSTQKQQNSQSKQSQKEIREALDYMENHVSAEEKFENSLNTVPWMKTNGGYMVPSFMFSAKETFVDDVPADVVEHKSGEVEICYWPLLGAWAATDYPEPNNYLSSTHKVDKVTYTNKKGIYSGYLNDGRVFYMRVKYLSGEYTTHVSSLVLIFPKSYQKSVEKLIDMVQKW